MNIKYSGQELDKSSNYDSAVCQQVKKKYVLVVDDEASILRALKRTFYGQPFELHTAQSGEEAIRLFQQYEYDLVLSDMRMPGMNGAEVLKRAYDFNPASVRMLISGFSDHDLIIKAINNGRIHGFVEKPWSNHFLVDKVKALLTEQKTDNAAQKSELLSIENSIDDIESMDTAQNQGRQVLVMMNQMMRQRLPEQWSHCRRVAKLARLFARYMNYPVHIQSQCYMVGSFYALGRMLLADELNRKAEHSFSKSEYRQLMQHFNFGQNLLALDDKLSVVMEAIKQLPSSEFKEQNRIEARIVSMIIHYDKLISGQLTPNAMSVTEAQKVLKSKKGSLFDPDLVEHFIRMVAICQKQQLSGAVKRFHVGQLEPGMCLAEHLKTASGQIWLSKGTILTSSMIGSLKATEQKLGAAIVLFIA